MTCEDKEALKLYQTEWCSYCVRVRARMAELGIDYTAINVPNSKAERKELLEISGQTGVPTLVTTDGKIIADDDDAIIDYLNENFDK